MIKNKVLSKEMRRNKVRVQVPSSRMKKIQKDENTHYPVHMYNHEHPTNQTIKQPYYCYKARSKCAMCSQEERSSRLRNRELKKEMNQNKFTDQ